MAKNTRELALFNLAIDSKLRGCDLVKLKVCDVAQGGRVSSRAIIMQQKTHRPVQFEITEQTRDSLANWISQAQLKSDQYLFPSLIHDSPHLSTRQYARIVEHCRWLSKSAYIRMRNPIDHPKNNFPKIIRI
jgi:integrase